MKRIFLLLLLGFTILSLAACATAGTPISVTSQPTSIPPTQGISATITASRPDRNTISPTTHTHRHKLTGGRHTSIFPPGRSSP